MLHGILCPAFSKDPLYRVSSYSCACNHSLSLRQCKKIGRRPAPPLGRRPDLLFHSSFSSSGLDIAADEDLGMLHQKLQVLNVQLWHNVSLFQGVVPVQADLCTFFLANSLAWAATFLSQASFSNPRRAKSVTLGQSYDSEYKVLVTWIESTKPLSPSSPSSLNGNTRTQTLSRNPEARTKS